MRYYRLGYAPYTPILSDLIFEDKAMAGRYAKQHNQAGEFKGRGVKVYPCDSAGNIMVKGGK